MTAVVWSATNLTSTVTGGGTLTVTSDASGTPDPGRCDTSISGTQRIYWEETVTFGAGDANTATGYCNSSFASFTAGTFIGADANSMGHYGSTGEMFVNNVVIATIATFATGAVLCTAIDFGAGKVWRRVGATGNWNNDVLANQNPAVGSQVGGIALTVTGALFPLYGVVEDSGVSGTDTLAALLSSFAGAVPTGFSALDPGSGFPASIMDRPATLLARAAEQPFTRSLALITARTLPFRLTDWPPAARPGRVPPDLVARGSLPLFTYRGGPFASRDWPAPARPGRVPPDLVARGSLPLFTYRGGPFSLRDWPAAIRRPLAAIDQPVQNTVVFQTVVAVTAPFANFDWPPPARPGRVPPDLVARGSLPLFTYSGGPFTNFDWPPASRRPLAAIDQSIQNTVVLQTVVVVAPPFANFDWPPPARPGRVPPDLAARGSLPLTTYSGGPFSLYDWPPAARLGRPLPDLIESGQLPLTTYTGGPFSLLDWPPAARVLRSVPEPAPANTAVLQIVVVVQPPFANFDWPLPARARTTTSDFSTSGSLALATYSGGPFALYDWPLAARVGPLATEHPQQNTVPAQTGPSPFAFYDWQPAKRPVPLAQEQPPLNVAAINTPVVVVPGGEWQYYTLHKSIR